MSDSGVTKASRSPIEAVLADELSRGDVVLGTIGPMLGMLLANHDNALFADEIVARVRAMTASVARQMLVVEADAAGEDDPYAFAAGKADALEAVLAGDLGFLGHCHALALEHRLAMQLERRNAIDPVLSPLLQSLIASSDAATAQLSMALLASQARFVQQQRRMELALGELPEELFALALAAWRDHSGSLGENASAQAELRMRERYDPESSRFSLLVRVAGAVDNGMQPAMSLSHAGTALFLTAIAIGSKQDRDLVAVSTNASQLGRLALTARSAGLKSDQIVEQFALIHPHVALPDALDTLRTDRAMAILDASAHRTVN